MFPDARRDLVVREPEILGKTFEATRFLDGVEVGALQVFDQPEHELGIVAGVAAYDGGYRLQAGEPGRAPPAFACDELVTVTDSPHEQRLEDTVEPNGFGQLA